MKKPKTKKQKIVRKENKADSTYKTYFFISLVIITFLTGFLTYFIFAQYNPFTLMPATVDFLNASK